MSLTVFVLDLGSGMFIGILKGIGLLVFVNYFSIT